MASRLTVTRAFFQMEAPGALTPILKLQDLHDRYWQ